MAEQKPTTQDDLGKLQQGSLKMTTTEEWLEVVSDPEVRAMLLSQPQSSQEAAQELINAHLGISARN